MVKLPHTTLNKLALDTGANNITHYDADLLSAPDIKLERIAQSTGKAGVNGAIWVDENFTLYFCYKDCPALHLLP